MRILWTKWFLDQEKYNYQDYEIQTIGNQNKGKRRNTSIKSNYTEKKVRNIIKNIICFEIFIFIYKSNKTMKPNDYFLNHFYLTLFIICYVFVLSLYYFNHILSFDQSKLHYICLNVECIFENIFQYSHCIKSLLFSL